MSIRRSFAAHVCLLTARLCHQWSNLNDSRFCCKTFDVSQVHPGCSKAPDPGQSKHSREIMREITRAAADKIRGFRGLSHPGCASVHVQEFEWCTASQGVEHPDCQSWSSFVAVCFIRYAFHHTATISSRFFDAEATTVHNRCQI